jgi:hypothetical protein
MPSDRNTVLTFALAALRLMPTRPTITRLVTVRRGSCVAEFFFVATFRYPRFESLRGPASSLRPANLFASCPAARLPIAFDTGGALGIWALRSFHPVRGSLGRDDPPSAASPGQGCFHLADPLAVSLVPSSIYFCRGIGRSIVFTHILKRSGQSPASKFGFWVFPRDQPFPRPPICGRGPMLPWAFFPFQVFRRQRDAPAQARPRTGQRFPATASGALPLLGFSSMFASPSGAV